jgi:dTMP kinase
MSQWRRSRRIFDLNQAANKPNRVGRDAASLPCHSNNFLKFLARHRLDRQARQTQQRHSLQLWIELDLIERDRLRQCLFRRYIHRAPIALCRCRIRVGFPDHPRNPNNFLADDAMIKKDRVVFAHRSQIVSRRVISHTRPLRFAVLGQVRPRVGGRFLFHEPEIFHLRLVTEGALPDNRSSLAISLGAQLVFALLTPFDSTTALGCFTLALMSRGAFITFEGSEGCGKSTQVLRLAACLEQAGVRVLITREPGGTAIGEKIRDLLQFAPESFAMTPETELLLFEASRSQLVRETIRPALEQGTAVISDRFFDSTTVYQGVARKLEPEIVATLNNFAVGSDRPDLTIILDVDVATARARMLRRVRPVGVVDRMEQEPVEFYERVCEAYRELARIEPDRFLLIDGARSPDAIENQIWDAVTSRFPAFAIMKQSKIENRNSKI